MDSAEVPAPSVPKNTTTLPIAALTPCKGQPRKHFDEAALDELAASIRSQGVIQPLLVRPRRTETATIYEIVAGSRALSTNWWPASAAGGPRSAPGLPKCRFICGNCPMRTP